jgi:hypothetical protein
MHLSLCFSLASLCSKFVHAGNSKIRRKTIHVSPCWRKLRWKICSGYARFVEWDGIADWWYAIGQLETSWQKQRASENQKYLNPGKNYFQFSTFDSVNFFSIGEAFRKFRNNGEAFWRILPQVLSIISHTSELLCIMVHTMIHRVYELLLFSVSMKYRVRFREPVYEI